MSNVSSKTTQSPAPQAVEGEVGASYKAWPWGPGAAIVMTFVSFLGAQLLVGVIVVAILGTMGWSSKHIEYTLSNIAPLAAVTLVSEAAALGLLWLFLRRRKANWRLLGFARGIRAKDLGLAVLWFVIYFALLLVVSSIAQALLGVDLNQKQELGFDKLHGASETLLGLVCLVLVPPIVEEIVFRGFLFTGLRKKLPFIYAAIATSLLFAVPHLLESSKGPLWVAGIDTCLMSLILCHLREKTGALWAPMLIHFLKNGLAFLALYVFSLS